MQLFFELQFNVTLSVETVTFTSSLSLEVVTSGCFYLPTVPCQSAHRGHSKSQCVFSLCCIFPGEDRAAGVGKDAPLGPAASRLCPAIGLRFVCQGRSVQMCMFRACLQSEGNAGTLILPHLRKDEALCPQKVAA